MTHMDYLLAFLDRARINYQINFDEEAGNITVTAFLKPEETRFIFNEKRMFVENE